MQTFKADKKIFLINGLKSWVWTGVFAAFLFLLLTLFSSLTSGQINLAVAAIFLLKLSDTFTQYHVEEIQIDESTDSLIFVLKSLLSGEKIKKYGLRSATAELMLNSGMKRYWSTPYVLKIVVAPKDTLRISNQYGFSLDTLRLTDQALKAVQTK